MTAGEERDPGPSSTEGLTGGVAWEELSRTVERFVERFFVGRPEIDVEDVVQDSLLDLLRRQRAPGEIEDVPALALVIARRRCIDALRRSYVSRRLIEHSEDGSLPERESDSPSPQAHLERSEVRAVMVRLRVRLTPRCRMVLDQLVLGLRLAEVARVLGTSAGAVRNRWFHCRRQILALLQGWGMESKDWIE